MDKQSFWNDSYKKAKQRGLNAIDSKIIANLSLSEYKEEVNGTRSIAVDSNFYVEGDVFDVLVGYVDSGAEDGLLDQLDSSGFDNFDELQTKADLEHFNHDFGAGVGNDLDEKWQNFAVDANMYKKGNEIRAKVHPKSDLDFEFIEDYKKGVYGASIEYKGVKHDNKITDWQIQGFSFTKNPNYNQTRPKNTEN